MTTGKTKSGTIVYLISHPTLSPIESKKVLSNFIRIYNKSFTSNEQKTIGNIMYDYTNKHTYKATGKYAATYRVKPTSTAKELNAGNPKMIDLHFSKDSYKDEFITIHELIHAKQMMKMSNMKKVASRKSEQKTDFEAVARIPKKGFENHIAEIQNRLPLAMKMDEKNIKRPPIHTPSGYYFSPIGTNQTLIKQTKSLPNTQRLVPAKFMLEGIIHDRKLLTGSLNTNIVGDAASSKAKKLFPKSFFNQKSFAVK